MEHLDLIYYIKIGDLENTRIYLDMLLEKNHGTCNTPEYAYALRTAISRNDPEMCAILTGVLPNDKVLDARTVIAASYKDVNVFIAVVGVDGHCMMNSEFNSEYHPIITACSVGNYDVVKFIVDWIRDGDGAMYLLKSMDLEKLKRNVIIQAAMSNSVSICKLVAIKYEQKVLAFNTLISYGHIDGAKRFVSELDFTNNDFELLKVCAPYPDLLEVVMGSESLQPYRNDMPTVYSQLAMNSHYNHKDYHVDQMTNHFNKQLKIAAKQKMIETGCSTKDAITSAYYSLYNHYN